MSFTYTPEQCDEVTLETIADILASDISARFDISDVEAQRIASVARDGVDFVRMWENEDFWKDRAACAPKYAATISHHSTSRAPYGWNGRFLDTLHAAKINATREFGDGCLDHVIQIVEIINGDGAVIASRRVGDTAWSNVI